MRPKLELIDKPLIERILDEAFQLIEDPGVRVAPYIEDLLRAAGINVTDGVAHIPEALARRLLDLVPRGFCLYDRLGKPAVHYIGDAVHFDPGSSCLNILDPETQQPRPGNVRRSCAPCTGRRDAAPVRGTVHRDGLQ